MDIIAFYELEEWEKEYFHKAFPQATLKLSIKKIQEEQDQEFFQATILSPFIYSDLTRETLHKFPNLRMIATRSTGYDHIDLEYCLEKNIIVTNVPNYGANTVAEHTFALILAISRQLVRTVNRTRRGEFSLDGLTGFDLAGKTIGVVGDGMIGTKVIKLALAFEMSVMVYTRHPEKYALSSGVKPVSLIDLFANSDIVTLHLPLTPETEHIINTETIKQFKKGSMLINTARGSLVESQAILEGIETGILIGAGLDVLDEECGLKEERELLTEDYLNKCDIKTQLLNHVLINRKEVLFTLHNGFNSHESVKQILDITIKNIMSFQDKHVINVVK